MKKIGIYLYMMLFGFTGLAMASERIELTIPLPLSGTKSKVGIINKNSYEIAAEEINAAGGIRGKTLTLHFEDSADNPVFSQQIAERAIAKGQNILVGEYTSDASKALAQFAEQRKIPYLIVTGAADEIAQQGYRYVFRLGPPASYYTSGLGAFLDQVVQAKTMAVIHEDEAFTTSVAKGMIEEAGRRNLKVVSTQSHAANARNFNQLLEEVKKVNPDVLFLISYETNAAELMTQIKRRRLDLRVIVGGGGGFAIPQFIARAQDAAEYFITATLWSPAATYAGNRAYAETYKQRHGDYPSYHGAEAYSALYVVKDALERAPEWTPEALRDALAATNTITAFGPVQFENNDRFQNQNFAETLVLQVQNGVFEVIWPESAATKPYVFPIPTWKERNAIKNTIAPNE